MSWENLIKDQSILSSKVIIFLILLTSSHDNVWISLGENWCWSLLGLLKGLSRLNFEKMLWLSLIKFLYCFVGVLFHTHWLCALLLENLSEVRLWFCTQLKIIASMILQWYAWSWQNGGKIWCFTLPYVP